jgi:hypothetical protein
MVGSIRKQEVAEGVSEVSQSDTVASLLRSSFVLTFPHHNRPNLVDPCLGKSLQRLYIRRFVWYTFCY